VLHPKSTEWLVLDIASLEPWSVTLYTIEWGCWVQTWDHHDDKALSLDAKHNRLEGHGATVDIVGPRDIGIDWKRAVPGSLPDTSRDTEPPGACNGSVAAWDHSH
jgi:hypothetical protein